MSKTRYQLQESYESVIKKFDEIDNSMKRTEGLIKGLYFYWGLFLGYNYTIVHEWWRCRKRC